MTTSREILLHLLETDEDDFDTKDVVEPEDSPIAGKTTVERHGRWKIVKTDRFDFLISFLTPVAYFDRSLKKHFVTLKQWSPTTNKHISKWRSLIAKSPEWKNDPANLVKSEYGGGMMVQWPQFTSVRQKRISDLFRSLIPTMQMKSHLKRRMYHVDPRMRQGSATNAGKWLSGHLKHHDTGDEGLPRPDDAEYEEFFKDFEPSDPNYYPWGSGLRDTEPHETGNPDEE